jgi:hypothetical protein
MRAWLEILRERHPGVSWVANTREIPNDQLRNEAVMIAPASAKSGGQPAAALAA